MKRAGLNCFGIKLCINKCLALPDGICSAVWHGNEEFRKRVGVDRKEETYESYENSYNCLLYTSQAKHPPQNPACRTSSAHGTMKP